MWKHHFRRTHLFCRFRWIPYQLYKEMAFLFNGSLWFFRFVIWDPCYCLHVCNLIRFVHYCSSDGSYLGNGSKWFWLEKWVLAISVKRTYETLSILFKTELPDGMECSSPVVVGEEYDLSYVFEVLLWYSRSLVCVRDGMDIRLELPSIGSSDEVSVFFESSLNCT